MPRLNQLCKNQRQRKEVIRTLRIKLASALLKMRDSSKRAIDLLGQLQNENDGFLLQGNVICSKIQHAVVECDPDSIAVAAAVVSIDSATCSVASTSALSVDVVRATQQFNDVAMQIIASQKKTNDFLDVMCEAHQHAFDVHEKAVDAIQNGFGTESGPGIQCASCGGDAEPIYAARTGMCLKCVKHSADMSLSGWTRCNV
jgi:hypothetical protein